MKKQQVLGQADCFLACAGTSSKIRGFCDFFCLPRLQALKSVRILFTYHKHFKIYGSEVLLDLDDLVDSFEDLPFELLPDDFDFLSYL